jgi:hypothetical protein
MGVYVLEDSRSNREKLQAIEGSIMNNYPAEK